MGMFKKGCGTAPRQTAPDPSRWVLIDKAEFPGGYALRVRYPGCTNFEGEKIMVFRGVFKIKERLDPHFSLTNDSPIARFRPTSNGWKMAIELASNLPQSHKE